MQRLAALWEVFKSTQSTSSSSIKMLNWSKPYASNFYWTFFIEHSLLKIFNWKYLIANFSLKMFAWKFFLEICLLKICSKEHAPIEQNANIQTKKLKIPIAIYNRSHITDVFRNNQIEKVDFSQPEQVRTQVNTLVEQVTQGEIKDFLPPGSVLSSMNAVLANAAFFKGSWANPFDSYQTQNTTFHGDTDSNIELMRHFDYKINWG